jgi:hypothetical protein
MDFSQLKSIAEICRQNSSVDYEPFQNFNQTDFDSFLGQAKKDSKSRGQHFRRIDVCQFISIDDFWSSFSPIDANYGTTVNYGSFFNNKELDCESFTFDSSSGMVQSKSTIVLLFEL